MGQDEGSDAEEEAEEEEEARPRDVKEQLVPDVKKQIEPEPPARRQRSASLTSRGPKSRAMSSGRKGKQLSRPKSKLKTERSEHNSTAESRKFRPPPAVPKAVQAKEMTLFKAVNKQRPSTSRFPSI